MTTASIIKELESKIERQERDCKAAHDAARYAWDEWRHAIDNHYCANDIENLNYNRLHLKAAWNYEQGLLDGLRLALAGIKVRQIEERNGKRK